MQRIFRNILQEKVDASAYQKWRAVIDSKKLNETTVDEQ